jgi:large subunit ribosomal protein L4
MKAAALRGALSDRARGGKVHVVAGVVSGDTPSTKQAVAALGGLPLGRNVLVVCDRGDDLAWKSLRNVVQVHLIAPDQLNTYDVLVSDDVVFTEPALRTFLAGAPKGKSAKAVATSTEAETVEAVVPEAAPEAAVPETAEPVVEDGGDLPIAGEAATETKQAEEESQ